MAIAKNIDSARALSWKNASMMYKTNARASLKMTIIWLHTCILYVVRNQNINSNFFASQTLRTCVRMIVLIVTNSESIVVQSSQNYVFNVITYLCWLFIYLYSRWWWCVAKVAGSAMACNWSVCCYHSINLRIASVKIEYNKQFEFIFSLCFDRIENCI